MATTLNKRTGQTIEHQPRKRQPLIDFEPSARWLDERGIGIHRPVFEFLMHPVDKISNIFDLMGELTAFLFINQLITGIILAIYYRPTISGAFVSLQNITYVIPAGVWIRGLHVYGASAMVVAIFIHMCRVFWYGGYKKPRELTWMIGVILLVCTLGLSFTGYLLPWNQEAYWATMVGTQIPFYTPFIGNWVVTLLRSGFDLTGETLTRFYAIHMLVLPGLLMGALAFHLALVVRQGVFFLTEEHLQ
ncbi:MAG: cytochrome b N-terminal domain-containing protein [Chloroflexi bacterium]|nr:cytochrome b N-terminal domain-containing protein [Chloroflexota bacterium]